EAACQKLRKQPITVADGSAVLTGLLVAFVLPVHAPWYVPMMASFVAIAVVKQAFGGLGCNIWNPALMGRAFVLSAWAALVTAGSGWPVPYHHTAATVDAVTAATPLTKAKKQLKMFNKGKTAGLPVPKTREEAIAVLASIQAKGSTPLGDLFVGRVGGCIGEVSALALLIGGMALILLRYVKWQVPVLFIGTTALLSWALPLPVQAEGTRYYIWFAGQPLFHMLAGGLFLGAFFMATDMVTSPITLRGK
ncbi:RnfABCDGE type electron transport complex subunit D, partial [bacterium]|nr:RnfABCDGE type electron transport complex subunit D [bacterium]